jgi:hypothetical protein
MMIIGNGTSDTERKNIYTLHMSGTAEFAGDIIAFGCSGTESPISLKNVNSFIQALVQAIGDGDEFITNEEVLALFS